ncbi:putative C2 domain-containing protein [Helianthus debilis subsp. tardiflorus]
MMTGLHTVADISTSNVNKLLDGHTKQHMMRPKSTRKGNQSWHGRELFWTFGLASIRTERNLIWKTSCTQPLAYTLVEIVAASDMKYSDMNGLADLYGKGQLGAYRFQTKTQRKTLSPKWQEEFKIPITTWESPNLLIIKVRNKDHFIDDILGDCSIKINDLRDGQRHDMWLPLQNIITGRLHTAIQVSEVDTKVTEQPCDADASTNELSEDSPASDVPIPERNPARSSDG